MSFFFSTAHYIQFLQTNNEIDAEKIILMNPFFSFSQLYKLQSLFKRSLFSVMKNACLHKSAA